MLGEPKETQVTTLGYMTVKTKCKVLDIGVKQNFKSWKEIAFDGG